MALKDEPEELCPEPHPCLHQAAGEGCTATVEALLNGGRDVDIDVDTRDEDERSALHLAAGYGHGELVVVLLQKGATKDAVDKDGRTPLHLAAGNGHLPAVHALVGASVDTSLRDHVTGSTPLHDAADYGHDRVVSALLQKGADTNILDDDGDTPLLLAIDQGYSGVVTTLLGAGADCSIRQPDGDSAVHLAVRLGHGAIVSALIGSGADMYACDGNGQPPLHIAVNGGHHDIVDTLLGASADINFRCTPGACTPLQDAASTGQGDMVYFLLNKGADKDALGQTGKTTLCFATAGRHFEVVKILVGAGASIDHFYRESGGCSALTRAAMNGDVKTVFFLLSRGADVRMTDVDGCTPLHWVCHKRPVGAERVVILLWRWGADETLKSPDDGTPMDLLEPESEDEDESGSVDESPECSSEEVERVRQLLAHAPADRMWRRRDWLIMLRVRHTKNSAADRDGRVRKAARTQGTEGGNRGITIEGGGGAGSKRADLGEVVTALLSLRGAQSSTTPKDGGGADGGGADFRGVVTAVLDLPVEGVFRAASAFCEGQLEPAS